MEAEPAPVPRARHTLPLSSVAHRPWPSTPTITLFEHGDAAIRPIASQPADIPARFPVALIHDSGGARIDGTEPAHEDPLGVDPASPVPPTPLAPAPPPFVPAAPAAPPAPPP